MLPNMLAYPVALLGTLRSGLIAVNVNPLYTPRELKEQLKDCGATVIVIMENFAHKLEQVIAETDIRHVVVARLGDFVPVLRRWAFNFANSYIQRAVPAWHFETFTMLQDACSRAPSEHYTDADTRATDVALLQYTGGTTGVPKGAMLTHRNLIANTLQCLAWTGSRQQIREGNHADAAAALSHLLADREPGIHRGRRRLERAGHRSAQSRPAGPHLS